MACLLISPPSQAVVLCWADTAAVSVGKNKTKLNQLFPALLFPTDLLPTLKMLCPIAMGPGWNWNRWLLHSSVSDELISSLHLRTPLGRELSCCSPAHLIFLSPHPNRNYFQDSATYQWSGLPPRSCSSPVISPCVLKVFTFQSSRGMGRNAGTVLA